MEEIAARLGADGPAALLLGGVALRTPALTAARRAADGLGAKLLAETFPARLQRGAGIPAVERLAYLGEMAAAQLEGLRHLVLVDAKAPVSFFAYPGRPSYLVPEGCQVHTLAAPGEDVLGSLLALAEAVGAGPHPADLPAPSLPALSRPDPPEGALTARTAAAALGLLLPEGAIVSDEGNTSGLFAATMTAGAPPHDWLCLTGGAIGQGLPVAVGAAVACPGRRVVSLQADGSALYTLQAWWTMAREGLDVTTILLSNRSYAVLNMELKRVGAGSGGPKARAMLDLTRPDLDFVSLAQGMGVPATRADTAEDFTSQLEAALRTPGPNVVEAVLSRE